MIPILDTHQHLISPELMPFEYEQYLRANADTGIAGTIFMEASPDNWRAEAPVVTDLVEREGSLICGIVANYRP